MAGAARVKCRMRGGKGLVGHLGARACEGTHKHSSGASSMRDKPFVSLC